MKKILLTAIGITLILGLTQATNAYSTPDEYKPGNLPFGIDYGNTVEGTGEQGSFAAIIILQIIAGGLLYFAAPIAVIMITWGAWQMVTGGAESEKLEQSKKHLTWSAIGLLVIILSYSAVRFAISFVFDATNPPKSPAPSEETATYIEPILPNEGKEHLLS